MMMNVAKWIEKEGDAERKPVEAEKDQSRGGGLAFSRTTTPTKATSRHVKLALPIDLQL